MNKLIIVPLLFVSSLLFADNVPVIELKNTDKIEKYIGKVVMIQGVVSKTKIPQIHGIDVKSDDPDLRGKEGRALGVLERWEVTVKDIESLNEIEIAHRGPGIFYRLYDTKTKMEAQVKETEL